MNMNLKKEPPVLLGRSLIDMIRSIPGYDFISDAGGSVLSVITAGGFSPEVQKNLMNYLDFVTEMTGKRKEQLTAQDLERYADLYQGRGFSNPWVIGGIGVGVLALVLILAKK